MVPLPLFKLGALFVRHITKYGANQIKAQAHEHPRFRAFAARYGQKMHQLNMRMSVALLRNPDKERKAKEKAEAPTVKTLEQQQHDDAMKMKQSTTPRKVPFENIWRRKFRPLPEEKAVDLFASVIGDAFILGVAGGLIVYEYWKSSQKPDANRERIEELNKRFAELQQREEELEAAEKKQKERVDSLEEVLRALRDPKTKQPLLPTLQAS